MRIELLTPDHLRALDLQPAQRFLLPMISEGGEEYAQWLCGLESFAAIHNGRVVACAGLFPLWPNVARGWAMLAAGIGGAQMRVIHRTVALALSMRAEHRIEIDVAAGFEQGHRWARMLGFNNEGLMRSYAPDGADYYRYARVKNG